MPKLMWFEILKCFLARGCQRHLLVKCVGLRLNKPARYVKKFGSTSRTDRVSIKVVLGPILCPEYFQDCSLA